MTDVFDLEPHTCVRQDDSYILSYPHILSYFSGKTTFDAADMVCGTHMVYGWMPTVLELYPETPNDDLAAGATILTKAKDTGVLSDEEITSLASLVNHSLVGASKLLHFVKPDCFAIWDSKIYAFVFQKKPHNYRVNEVAAFIDATSVCWPVFGATPASMPFMSPSTGKSAMRCHRCVPLNW